MILLYLAVAAAYLVGAFLEWRRLAGSEQSGSDHAAFVKQWLTPLALLGHVSLLALTVFAGPGVDLSLANALSAVAGLIVLFAWLGGLARTLPGVIAVTLPIAAVGVLLPAAFSNPHRFSFADQPLAAMHIAVALVAYALLIVAALQALMLLVLERRLHRGLPAPNFGTLPPLLTLERVLFRLVSLGYVLLTLTLASGALFSEELFGKPFTLTHKTVFSVLGWLVFGALLFGRRKYGWRGKTAFHWVLAGTALLFLAYLGSKFVLEVVLGR